MRRWFAFAAIVLCAVAAFPQTEVVTTTHTYKKAGGCDIQADVHRPAGKGPYPVVLWLHGGALIFGHRGAFRKQMAEIYVGAGYAVVSADYRLAPETKLADIWEDIRDVYAWVRREGPAMGLDARRIAVIGHSAGGYLSLTSGFRLTPRPQAIVSFYGYGDITGDWYAKPDEFYRREPLVTEEAAWASVGDKCLSGTPFPNKRRVFYLYSRQQGLWPRLVGGEDPSDKRAREYSAAFHVTRDFPPTLLIHGDNDTDVPVGQSQQMAAELKKHAVPHELMIIPGGRHGFDSDFNSDATKQAYARVLAFLKAHLK